MLISLNHTCLAAAATLAWLLVPECNAAELIPFVSSKHVLLARFGSDAEKVKSIAFLQDGAAREDVECLHDLGMCSEFGWGIKQSKQAAIDLYERSNRNGRWRSAVRLTHVRLQVNKLDDRIAIDSLVTAAHHECAEAAWLLGWCHEYGVLEGDDDRLNSKSSSAAREWLSRITNEDDPVRRFTFAYRWDLRSRPKPNSKRTIYWYSKSTRTLTDADSHLMAIMRQVDSDISILDDEEVQAKIRSLISKADARLLARLAAACDDALALMLQDFATELWNAALPELEIHARNGDESALLFMPTCYVRNGVEEKKFPRTIEEVRQDTAELGDVPSQLIVARSLYGAKNVVGAKKWYIRAANAGHPSAQADLAVIYRREGDDSRADMWKKAADVQKLEFPSVRE